MGRRCCTLRVWTAAWSAWCTPIGRNKFETQSRPCVAPCAQRREAARAQFHLRAHGGSDEDGTLHDSAGTESDADGLSDAGMRRPRTFLQGELQSTVTISAVAMNSDGEDADGSSDDKGDGSGQVASGAGASAPAQPLPARGTGKKMTKGALRAMAKTRDKLAGRRRTSGSGASKQRPGSSSGTPSRRAKAASRHDRNAKKKQRSAHM